MARCIGLLFTVGLTVASAAHVRAAEPAGGGDERLRAALRTATQQLNTVQSDLASAQASSAALTEENKALTAKYETLKKQMQAEKSYADKSVAGLGAQLNEFKAANARLTEALEKARAEGQAAAQAARAAEARNAKLTTENIALERRIEDRGAKNLALFLLANEILTRYEEYGLGKAIVAREPFVGRTRVKLENLVQDYQDKILDQRVTQ